MLIPDPIRTAMLSHARFCLPEEACGLLAADSSGRLRFVYCLTNAAASTQRFTVDPVEHFRALTHAERNGWELSGVFHSHVAGPPYPSATDVALAGDPEWIHIVVGPARSPAPRLRAFRIRDGRVTEEPVVVTGT